MLYLDTGCLVKLYYPEPESAAVAKIVAGESILYTDLHELELTTAMRRLKVFRGEAKLEHARAALGLVSEDLTSGKLSRGIVSMQSVMRDAVAISSMYAATIGCRSLDILHCSLAKATGAEAFVSTDMRQLAVARAESLPVRTIPQGNSGTAQHPLGIAVSEVATDPGNPPEALIPLKKPTLLSANNVKRLK